MSQDVLPTGSQESPLCLTPICSQLRANSDTRCMSSLIMLSWAETGSHEQGTSRALVINTEPGSLVIRSMPTCTASEAQLEKHCTRPLTPV